MSSFTTVDKLQFSTRSQQNAEKAFNGNFWAPRFFIAIIYSIITLITFAESSQQPWWLIVMACCPVIAFVVYAVVRFWRSRRLLSCQGGEYLDSVPSDPMAAFEYELMLTTRTFNTLVEHWRHMIKGDTEGHSPIPEHLHDFGDRLTTVRETLMSTIMFCRHKVGESRLERLTDDQLARALDLEGLHEVGQALQRHHEDTGISTVERLTRASGLDDAAHEIATLHRASMQRAAAG